MELRTGPHIQIHRAAQRTQIDRSMEAPRGIYASTNRDHADQRETRGGRTALRSAARRERAEELLRRSRPMRRTWAGRRARSLRERHRYSQAPPPPCSACSSRRSSRASSSAAVAAAIVEGAAAMGIAN
jgi:hypothetical protein